MKHICIACTLFLLATQCFATVRQASYTEKNYNIEFTYNDECYPGDALFLRMKFSGAQGNKKNKIIAKAELSSKKQHVASAHFYTVKSSMTSVDMLVGLPLSSYAVPEEYTIKVVYSVADSVPQEFSVPLVIQPKEFEEQTITYETENDIPPRDTTIQMQEQDIKFNKLFNMISSTASYNVASFIMPVETTVKVASFAQRTTYVYPKGAKYTTIKPGIAYAAYAGDPVVACAGGKVVLAENRIKTGNTIVIEHLPGLYSIYYHLQSLQVKEGQNVKQKDKIATALDAGNPNNAFHWEVRLNGVAVNPECFLTAFAYE